jgi:putative transposase
MHWSVKVREAGRVVNVHALIATGVNAEGYREIQGIDVTTAEDGAGWLAFWRSLTARGLSGVKLVTSDAHAGLVAAIGATVAGATWQRCRTHYATNRMAITPRHRGRGCAPCCTRSTTNQTLNPLLHNMTGSSTHCPTSYPRSPNTSRVPA